MCFFIHTSYKLLNKKICTKGGSERVRLMLTLKVYVYSVVGFHNRIHIYYIYYSNLLCQVVNLGMTAA